MEKYHNPCTAWRQRLSPYLKGTVIWQVWSDSPLKIRGVPPKAGGCYELMDNWQWIIDNWELKKEVGKLEMEISNYELPITNGLELAHNY
jgi:hypothetical protein